MKTIILALFLILTPFSMGSAIELSEFLDIKPLGQNIGKWQASELVSDYLMGRMFSLPSDRKKMWQLRFFTFEDRKNVLEKKNSFADFVKKFGLEKLQSKEDEMPYNDGTFRSFTHKDANEFLVANGKPPLPEGIFFIISYREIFLRGQGKEK